MLGPLCQGFAVDDDDSIKYISTTEFLWEWLCW